MSDEKPDVPDLRSLLREASRPSASVTVPIKQGLSEAIAAAEAELAAVAADPDAKPRRVAGKSPLRAKAEEVEALRAEMAASALTFRFSALTEAERERIRRDMGGRDNDDELNLRAIAGMCRGVVAADGTEYAETLTWQDFAGLRDSLGAATFDMTIDAAAARASGSGGWSVPFSSVASHILGTAK